MASKTSGLPHKLAVILHADVVGSTELVQRDERLAHQRINDAFGRFSKTIVSYGGRAHEVRGDALVAEFERASDAVCAALAFQVDNVAINIELADSIRPKARVGISLGEVVVADGTVTGAGVVMAQRVEQLADPGCVCITGAIHEALPQRMPFDQTSLGEQSVKGFDEPVRVYAVCLREGAEIPEPDRKASTGKRIAMAAALFVATGVGLFVWFELWAPQFEPATVTEMAQPLPDGPSIAVLPFNNYSDDTDLDYIASGLTEDLTTSLSKVPGLFVIARNSAATYKGKPVVVKQVAEDLGVRYVLEGSIQKAGDNLRFNTQLIDALGGHHLWASRFDRPARDVFAVQDEITKNVIVELQSKLTKGDPQAHYAARGTDNFDAWILRVEALGELYKWSREGHARAWELYQASHKADPKWARPVGGLALIRWYEAKRGWSDSREKSIQEGIAFAEQAIDLNPNDIIGYQALANLYFLRDEPEKAIALRRTTIELAPNDANNLAGTANRLNEFGGAKEAIELYERAARLNPKIPWWHKSGYGLALHLVGRKEEALHWAQDAVATAEKSNLGAGIRTIAYSRLAAVYADLNQPENANAVVVKILQINPKFTTAKYQKANPLLDTKKLAWYKHLLVNAGLPE